MDTFIDDPTSKYKVGQTVNAFVLSNDVDKIGLSLKQSLAASRDTLFLETFFEEERIISQAHARATGQTTDWKKYTVGSIVDATVAIVKDYGAILTLTDPAVKGFVVAEQAKVKFFPLFSFPFFLLSFSFSFSFLFFFLFFFFFLL